jgi:hypothetical protein
MPKYSKRDGTGKYSRKLSARERSAQVRRDMLRNSRLSLTRAARNRNVDPRTVRKYFGGALKKNSSGRIKVRPDDRLRQTLYIPGTEPGEEIPVPTISSHERRVVGKWMAALNFAGRGDFSRIRAFPRGQSIGGVTLPTSDYEIQRILDALVEAESPFEGLYRTIAGPS